MECKLFKVVIGNKIIDEFENSLQIISPINHKIIGSIPSIKTKKEIDLIYQNAKETFYKYRETSFNERKNRLLKFAQLLEKNIEEITEIIIWEIAKSKSEAKKEIIRSIEYIKETIEEYQKIIKKPLIYDVKEHNITGKIGKFIYEPLGVVLAISPFNYPVNLLISKIAPALISGNTVVFKPATQGSCVGSLISMYLYEAGFKNGEISCIIGKGSQIGDLIIENKNINMISFTGGTQVGINIAKKNPLIPVVLELGGKDAAIVLNDANINQTAKKIVLGAFNYNGQRCTGIKRVLADSSIKNELIKEIDKEIAKLKVGSASKGDFDITEMIDMNSQNYNLDLLMEAQERGAKTNQIIKKEQNILYPVALYDVSLSSRIAHEEQFGPILPIISFETIEEAIKICNSSEYGLQASIFTQNEELANKIASQLEVGTVNINGSPSRGPDIFPFLATKKSGKGVQGIRESILSMNRLKGIVENN